MHAFGRQTLILTWTWTRQGGWLDGWMESRVDISVLFFRVLLFPFNLNVTFGLMMRVLSQFGLLSGGRQVERGGDGFVGVLFVQLIHDVSFRLCLPCLFA